VPISARTRHLDWFATLAEHSASELKTPRQAQAFDWFRQELDNLRSALDWAIQSGNASSGLRIAAAMRRVWFHGHQREGQATLRALLELPGASAQPAVRAAALTVLGQLTRERGDLRQARTYGEQAVELGPPKAATVWAQGQAMTTQEAVAFALSAGGDV
jgi:hypothetical protein